ncbi:hypothetical protein IDH44_21100 [Paenibacillus sp. IB182496]|uniref:YtkA-like domain-containing protein n=1 Tax=Paenibacillus sabuli TaxID=2772509 RepID=A0A927GUH1_9BACL|nr:hypothetical protein [Paenibacillus sabuli]MBD2847697.1 hypothetical protein [Paenibacillus sabuli]
MTNHSKWQARTLPVLVLLLAGLLGACGQEPAPPATIDDPMAVAATIETTPAPPIAGEPAELRAVISGAELDESADITLDVRVDGEAQLFDASYEADSVFAGEFTFPAAGTYEVFVHIYVGDLHLTKKDEVVVE